MAAKFEVILMDDSASDAQGIDVSLQRAGYNVKLERLETLAAFESYLQRSLPDVVLSDLRLDGTNAFEVLSILKRSGADVPFIVVSATAADERSIDLFRLGAHGFVRKHQLDQLAPTIERELAAARIRQSQRAAEASLERAEARFRALVEHSGEAIVLLDRRGIITYLSESSVAVFGFPPGELAGKVAFELIHPEDLAMVREAFAELLAEFRRTRAATVRARHGDGSWHWMQLTGTNLFDDPSVGALVVNFRDVTAERRAQEMLQKSERLFKALVEYSSEGLLLLDCAGKIILSGPPVLGHGRDEWQGRDPFELIHQEDRENVRRTLAAILPQAGSFTGLEFRARHADGSWRWVESNARNLLSDPDVSGVVVNYRDITAHKQFEEHLRERAELLDLAHDAILSLRLDGTIEFWNRGAEELYGWTREEALGRISHRLLQTKFSEPLEEVQRKLLTSGGWQGELEHVSKAGTRLIVASRWAVRRDTAGQPNGFLEIIRDITERRRMEDQMRHTQKLESIGVLAGGVAHDFNNLLTGVMGNASLMLESMAPKDLNRDLLVNVLEGAEKAANLTRQLLAYAGKGRYLVEPVNLSALIEELAGLLRTTLPKHVQLRLDLDRGLPLIQADSAQMQQVLMNLVINGAEAIPEATDGTVLVTTKSQSIDDNYIRQILASEQIRPGEYIAVEVHDSGVGMTPEVQARIFDPFFTTKFTGRGLGLSAVLGIIRGHRGAIKIYSTPGKGTTFKLLFPVFEGAARAEAQGREAELPASSGVILVVDDEEIVLRTAASVLRKAGYEVLTAVNGREAVDVFREHAHVVRAILLDMTMPVLSGEATLRELRAVAPAIPVILSSGYNEVEAIQRFAGKGLAGFLQKPYSARALLEMLRKILAA